MGIGRVNLAAKTVDFFTLGPSTQVSFTLAPDRKTAYGLLEDIGHHEFWKFDLDRRRLASRVEFKGRPRMGLKTSSAHGFADPPNHRDDASDVDRSFRR
jgi:hypothetical protein